MLRRLGGFVAFLLIVTGSARAPAHGAEITASVLNEEKNQYIITIEGEISTGDQQRFAKLASQYETAAVLLNSPGGTTLEAIEIGKVIRIRGYSTFVIDGFSCDSACALIWLSGKNRFLGTHSRVGFHATFVEENGSYSISGPGNAIVGSYFALLSIPQEAIYYLSSARPDSLNYIDLSNAGRLGIDVKEFVTENNPSSSTNANTPVNSRIYATVGNWSIAMDDSLGGGCFAVVSHMNETAIRFGFDDRAKASPYIIIFGDKWKSIEKGKEYKTIIQFDDYRPWTVPMSGLSSDDLKGLWLTVTDLTMFDEIASSKRYKMSYQGAIVSVGDLTDSARAIASLRKCENEHRVKSDPFSPR